MFNFIEPAQAIAALAGLFLNDDYVGLRTSVEPSFGPTSYAWTPSGSAVTDPGPYDQAFCEYVANRTPIEALPKCATGTVTVVHTSHYVDCLGCALRGTVAPTKYTVAGSEGDDRPARTTERACDNYRAPYTIVSKDVVCRPSTTLTGCTQLVTLPTKRGCVDWRHTTTVVETTNICTACSVSIKYTASPKSRKPCEDYTPNAGTTTVTTVECVPPTTDWAAGFFPPLPTLSFGTGSTWQLSFLPSETLSSGKARATSTSTSTSTTKTKSSSSDNSSSSSSSSATPSASASTATASITSGTTTTAPPTTTTTTTTPSVSVSVNASETWLDGTPVVVQTSSAPTSTSTSSINAPWKALTVALSNPDKTG